MTGLFKFIIVDNLSAFITLTVGIFAFIIYRLEKNDKEQSSAKIILEEIRAIERDVDKLKSAGNLMNVTPYNLSTSGWNNNRHTIVKLLDYDEVLQISQFFERVELLKELLGQWRNHYFSAMQEKSAVIQQKLATFATEEKNYVGKKKKLFDIYENDDHWFEPFLYKEQIKINFDLINHISTTTIGDKIKKISNKKWYHLNFR